MRSRGAALLHTIAFAIALFTQRMDDWPAMAWLFFFFAGCVALVFDSEKYGAGSFLRKANAAWLIAIGAVVLLVHRTYGITPEIWCLAAMPLLALCLKKEHLWNCSIGITAVVLVFAFGLIVQFSFGEYPVPAYFHYTWFNPDFPAVAWPMIDPNNAALVLNCVLIPCFYNMLYPSPAIDNENTCCSVRRMFGGFVLILALALLFTGSKAGIGCALIACFFLSRGPRGWRWPHGVLAIAVLAGALYFWHPLIFAFASRLPLWQTAARLLDIHPLTGIGVGVFPDYYRRIRVEHYSSGFFAHNDLLQVAIEMGIPAAFIFGFQWVVAFMETWSKNRVSAWVLAVIMMQSLVEFQFYVPAVSLLAGFAMAWHTYLQEDRLRR